jgi:hypothetical protein
VPKFIIKKRADFPEVIRNFKQIKGICVGGCVDKDFPIDKKHAAHAHYNKADFYHGWICFRWKYQLKEKFTLLHEVAHIIAGPLIVKRGKKWMRISHPKKWREKVAEIGGTYYPYYSYYKNKKYLDYSHKKKNK